MSSVDTSGKPMIATYVTNTDLLVTAAKRLRAPFSLEQLVVAAWEYAPARFSLNGFTEYPDSHKVSSLLSDRSGPVAKGHLERVRPGYYALTGKGLERD